MRRIFIIFYLLLLTFQLHALEMGYNGPQSQTLTGVDPDTGEPKSLSITISGPNEFPGGRAKLRTTLDGDYNGWSMRLVNPDGTVADDVVNNNADIKTDPDIAQSLVQIKWEYQEGGAWQDIGYLSVGEPPQSLPEEPPPPPEDQDMYKYTNPFAEKMWLEVDGEMYKVPIGGSVTVAADEGQWHKWLDVFFDMGDPNDPDFGNITTWTETMGTPTPAQPEHINAPPEAEDIFTKPFDNEDVINIPKTQTYTTEVRDGVTWVVQTDSNGQTRTTGQINPTTNKPEFFDPVEPSDPPTPGTPEEIKEAKETEEQREAREKSNRLSDTTELDSIKMNELSDEDVSLQAMSRGSSAANSESSAIPTMDPSGFANTSTGAAPDFTISLPSRMGGVEMDLNPFRDDRLGSILPGLRAFLSLIVLMGFAGLVTKTIYDCVRDFNLSPQAVGNNVFGGTGAQVTALASATLMTVTIGGGIVTITTYLSGQFAIPSLYALASSNPLAGVSAKIVWMLDQVFPLSIILGALAAGVALRAMAATVLAFTAAIVRFIVL